MNQPQIKTAVPEVFLETFVFVSYWDGHCPQGADKTSMLLLKGTERGIKEYQRHWMYHGEVGRLCEECGECGENVAIKLMTGHGEGSSRTLP